MAETTFKIDEEEERKNIIDKYEKGREKVLQGNLNFYLYFLIKKKKLIF